MKKCVERLLYHSWANMRQYDLDCNKIKVPFNCHYFLYTLNKQ